jgi:hypothetical protein
LLEVIVKYRPRIAKTRLAMAAFSHQIFYDAEQAPCQYQAYADEHQHSDRDIHGTPQLRTEPQF